MAQEVRVVKCYSCELFQTHIAKKSKKWECKMCGEKQSLKKIFAQGSGKDCREYCQKLNMMKQHTEPELDVLPIDSDTNQPTETPGNKLPSSISNSKWSKYLSQHSSDDEEKDEEFSLSQVASSVISCTPFELPCAKKIKTVSGTETESFVFPVDTEENSRNFHFVVDKEDKTIDLKEKEDITHSINNMNNISLELPDSDAFFENDFDIADFVDEKKANPLAPCIDTTNFMSRTTVDAAECGSSSSTVSCTKNLNTSVNSETDNKQVNFKLHQNEANASDAIFKFKKDISQFNDIDEYSVAQLTEMFSF